MDSRYQLGDVARENFQSSGSLLEAQQGLQPTGRLVKTRLGRQQRGHLYSRVTSSHPHTALHQQAGWKHLKQLP